MSKSRQNIMPYIAALDTIISEIYVLTTNTSMQIEAILDNHKEEINSIRQIHNAMNELRYMYLVDDDIHVADAVGTIHTEKIQNWYTYHILKQILTKKSMVIKQSTIEINYENNTDINLIFLQTATSEAYSNTLKEYANEHKLTLITKLQTIKEKSYNDLIKRYHGNDIILQPFVGFAYDMKHNTYIISKTLCEHTKSTTTLKHMYFLLNPETEWIDYNKVPNTSDLKVKELHDLCISHMNKLNWVKEYLLEIKLNKHKKTTLEQNKRTIVAHIEDYKIKLMNYIEQLDHIDDAIYRLENEKTEFKLGAMLSRLITQNKLDTYSLESNNLTLYWKALPIVFFDKVKLEKSAPNLLYSHETRCNMIKDIINDKLYLYTLPFRTTININTLEFISYQDDHLKYNYNGMNWNRHPLYNNGRGCVGTFDVPILEAKQEHNLTKLIMLILQFYQTITVNDPLGNDAIRYLPICNEEGIITNWTSHNSEIDRSIYKLGERA